ncbi:MAG: glutamate racemase [Deltaproteobacteria bacterium]|nr:glutamate racemase [Deltaproteobacteria bacterium]
MIGIFDSGIGGLTVVREVLKQLPRYRIVYFGDTARTPYGPKSPRTIIEYALEDTEFLLKQGAQIIVVACNSVSSVATAVLKERFRVPIFEVIAPAVRTTLALTRRRRVGIIGTRATIDSGVYERSLKALDPEIQVFSHPCPLLVPLVEEGWLKRTETKQIVRKYLYPLKLKQIDTLVLGCTHYPLLKGIIQTKIGRRVRVIDSSQEVAAWVKTYLEENPTLAGSLSAAEGEGGGHRFFVSDLTPNSEAIARDFLGRPITLEMAGD